MISLQELGLRLRRALIRAPKSQSARLWHSTSDLRAEFREDRRWNDPRHKWERRTVEFTEDEQRRRVRDGYKTQAPIGQAFSDSGTEPTMPEMIVAVLATAHQSGQKSMSSREIAERIKAEFKRDDFNDDRISSTIWRLWKADRLRKIRQGVYALPKEKPVSEVSGQDAPTGLDENPAQGGEARPGGGT